MNALFEHVTHPHKPRNINVAHAQERSGLNDVIAVFLTRSVGSMWTAYSFVVLAIVGLFAILGVLSPLVALLVAWTSQTLIQLVLLPVIMVGQNVLNRHSELLAEEQFSTTQKTYHDIEQIVAHLNAQDIALLDVQKHMDRQRELLSKQTTIILHTQSEVKEILTQIHLAPLVDARPALACIDVIRENLIPVHNFLNASSLTTEHQKRMMTVWDAVSKLALLLGSKREEETLE